MPDRDHWFGQGCVAAVSNGLQVGQPGHSSARQSLERYTADKRMRQRTGAVAGVCFVFVGVLVAVGLGRPLLIAAGLALVGGVVALLARSIHRRQPGRFVRGARTGAVTARLATVRRQARPIANETRAFAARLGRSLAESSGSLWNRARALRQPATASTAHTTQPLTPRRARPTAGPMPALSRSSSHRLAPSRGCTTSGGARSS